MQRRAAVVGVVNSRVKASNFSIIISMHCPPKRWAGWTSMPVMNQASRNCFLGQASGLGTGGLAARCLLSLRRPGGFAFEDVHDASRTAMWEFEFDEFAAEFRGGCRGIEPLAGQGCPGGLSVAGIVSRCRRPLMGLVCPKRKSKLKGMLRPGGSSCVGVVSPILVRGGRTVLYPGRP